MGMSNVANVLMKSQEALISGRGVSLQRLR